MSNPTTEQIAAALLCIKTQMPCKKCYYCHDEECRSAVGRDAADLIEAQTARIHELEARVDAVEVVRCRDCKNLIAFADGHHSCGFKPFDGGVSAMDYCSRGERRVNDG